MRHLFFATACALIVSAGTVATADNFAQGAAAFDRGDHQTAFAVWNELAEQDHPDALFNLAIMHLEGVGVTADPARSVDLFERAAGHGDPIAAYNLGELYAEGRGVDQDHAAAAEWYRQAAAHDHPEAMLKLSNLHTNGLGVDKDVGLALQLMEQAQETECLLGETEHNHHARLVELVIGGSPH
jgi:uncharacterized protein